MEVGQNSDIIVAGLRYHLQTQDLGHLKAEVISQVFLKGQIVKTISVPYPKATSQNQILSLVSIQHNEIKSLILSGVLS